MTYAEALAQAKAAAAKEELIPCPVCGKLFIPFHKYGPAHVSGVFCCGKCAAESLDTMPKRAGDNKRFRACPVCGEEFEATHSREEVNRKYCSDKCARIAAHLPPTPTLRVKPKPVKKKCKICGKEFESLPSRKRKFCSRECATEALRKENKCHSETE